MEEDSVRVDNKVLNMLNTNCQISYSLTTKVCLKVNMNIFSFKPLRTYFVKVFGFRAMLHHTQQCNTLSLCCLQTIVKESQ